MNSDLHKLTTGQLKQYISQHRNDEEAFHAALQILLSRDADNATWFPSPYASDNVAAAMKTAAELLQAKLDQLEEDVEPR